MCNSIEGPLNIAKASLIDTEVWVKPAAFIIKSDESFAFLYIVTISPSMFDCLKFQI